MKINKTMLKRALILPALAVAISISSLGAPSALALANEKSGTNYPTVSQDENLGTTIPEEDRIPLLLEAGIHEDEAWMVSIIIWRQTGWIYDKVRYAGSNPYYGLCQAMPSNYIYPKFAPEGSDWENDPIAQVQTCTNYAVPKYGSWSNAYVWFMRNTWY